MINNLDHIGAEAIRLMTGADRDVAKAQAHIKQVWDAFTAAEEAGTTITINGVSLKKDWAKLINRTTRYCQMIAKEGDRKSQKKDANSVRPLALIKQLITVISETKDYAIVKGEAQEICDSLKWYPPAFKQENKEVKHYLRTGIDPTKPQPVKHARYNSDTTWCGKRSTHGTNMARQKKHATCPYCVAAMAANILIARPEKGQTPEQAVEAEKTRRAEREVQRIEYEKQPTHIQSPVIGKNRTEMTLCGEVIDIGTGLYEGTRMAYGAHAVATCPTCIEQSKQIGQVTVPMAGGMN